MSDDSSNSGGGGGGKSALIPIILSGVNLIATLALVGITFISFKKEQTAARPADMVSEDGEHGDGHGDAHGEAKDDGHGGGGHGEAKKEDGHGGGHGDAKGGKSESKFGKIVTLEQFMINLSTAGSVTPKYARVNISLEVPSGDTEGEVSSKMAQVRNTVIDLFNSKRPTDLATPEGRNYLKEEIRNALNGFLVTGKVKGVFFTNFAISN